MKVLTVGIDKVLLDPANARIHGTRNLETIKASLARFGQQTPIVVDADWICRKGNGTLLAARALEWDSIKVVRTTLAGSEATGFAIADNRSSELATWDDGVLAETLRALRADKVDMVALGFMDDEVDALLAELGTGVLPAPEDARATLAERFGVPPFSVLDARQGYWQERKRAWIALGIQSELGRGGGLTLEAPQVTTEGLNYYRNRNGKGKPSK